MEIMHISKENFQSEVLNSDKKVLVDFYADWCGPCKMLSPIIEDISKEIDDAKICKINVDEQGELAQKYGVMHIPTLLVIKNGEVVEQSTGVRSKSDILEMLKS